MESVRTVNKDPRAMRSHKALSDALLALLEEVPLERITIRDIVSVAGVGYTTFFRHHDSKEDLLETIAAEQIRCLFNLSLSVMNVEDGVASLFTYVNARRSLWCTLLTGGAALMIREEFLRLAHEVAVIQGNQDGWLPADLGAVLIAGGTLDLLTWWLRQSKPLPIKRMIAIYKSVNVNSVFEVNVKSRIKK